MRLTSEYRQVTALFDTPMEKEIEYEEADTVRTEFRVGPFTYVMSFEPENDRGSIVNVSFQLADIDAPDDELVEMMSKLVAEKWRPISLERAKGLERAILNNQSYDELKITGPYAIKIFGSVLNIIKDYRTKYRTNCIIFSADSENRSRLYQKMMKSAFPRAGIRVRPSPWGAGTEIRVCFI